MARIRSIRHAAALSAKKQRHECAWNNLVHTPLLELAFGHNLEGEAQGDQTVTAQFEPVMSAAAASRLASFPRLS
ncbi:hypothetical protein GGR56DRAFT_672591 [Xylariaceae sp. FL0804]|nr:hypothetical protein GGR56DRAFT_672591 [Xylariaceae sp. FL0804]